MVINATTSQARIEAADTHEQIIEALRECGLAALGERLQYLRNLGAHDSAEPPMEIESLRALARFLIGGRQLPDPGIGVTPDGLLMANWRVPPEGLMALEFRPDSLIRFAAISASAKHAADRTSINGELPIDEALAALSPFTSLIARQ